MKKILIVGATSAIAEATARRYAREGSAFFLVGRDGERLAALAADLEIAGAKAARFASLDVHDFERHRAVIDAAYAALGGLDLALIAHGTLGDQAACEKDFALTLRELNTNAISVISLLTELANRFDAQGSGTLAVISSVAGDRGRQSNYIYGTAKGALTIFLQGLRNRLATKGVQVLTIKPGFVDTPMTMAFKKGALWAKPEQIAEGIFKAVAGGKDVVYLPFFWRWIMLVIRLIPEGIFKKLKL
jgi:decaprenylphospho-beta-D-erythro-pentofuranosid-2-ulose 2-reductase